MKTNKSKYSETLVHDTKRLGVSIFLLFASLMLFFVLLLNNHPILTMLAMILVVCSVVLVAYNALIFYLQAGNESLLKEPSRA